MMTTRANKSSTRRMARGKTGLPSKLKATPPMAKADKLRAPATKA